MKLIMESRVVAQDEKGICTEIYKVEHPLISKVSYTYIGTEKDLDSFLLSMIKDYYSKHYL